jgi:hyperosmotically inducible protein
MRTPSLLLCLALAIAGASACSSTQSAGRQVDDSVITTKINAKFAADEDVRLRDVAVQTDEGVVTLTGRVEDLAEKSEAERLARQTEGVRSVRNLLSVGDRSDVGAER